MAPRDPANRTHGPPAAAGPGHHWPGPAGNPAPVAAEEGLPLNRRADAVAIGRLLCCSPPPPPTEAGGGGSGGSDGRGGSGGSARDDPEPTGPVFTGPARPEAFSAGGADAGSVPRRPPGAFAALRPATLAAGTWPCVPGRGIAGAAARGQGDGWRARGRGDGYGHGASAYAAACLEPGPDPGRSRLGVSYGSAHSITPPLPSPRLPPAGSKRGKLISSLNGVKAEIGPERGPSLSSSGGRRLLSGKGRGQEPAPKGMTVCVCVCGGG